MRHNHAATVQRLLACPGCQVLIRSRLASESAAKSHAAKTPAQRRAQARRAIAARWARRAIP